MGRRRHDWIHAEKARILAESAANALTQTEGAGI